MTLEDPVEYPMAMVRPGCRSAEDRQLDLRQRHPARHAAPGPGRHPGRRDPRCRNRRNGLPRRDDRPPGVSTLHTNSAIAAIARLLDIGVQPDIMAGNMHRHHRPAPGPPALRALPRRPTRPSRTKSACSARSAKDRARCYSAPPAASCATSRATAAGWRSWNCCASTPALDELIARRATTHEIRSRAQLQGFTTLADDGLLRVLNGVTSLEELARVVDLTDRM